MQGRKASAQFDELSKLGLVPQGQSFLDWIADGNFPSYKNAKDEQKAVSATFYSLISDIYGPLSEQWQVDRNNLDKAISGETLQSGYVTCAGLPFALNHFKSQLFTKTAS